jgi:hypothetical protein
MYNAEEFPMFPELQTLNKLDISIVNIVNSMKKITPCAAMSIGATVVFITMVSKMKTLIAIVSQIDSTKLEQHFLSLRTKKTSLI